MGDGAVKFVVETIDINIYRQLAIRADGAPAGASPEAILQRLVKTGYLTVHQARRAAQELPLIMNQQIPGYQLLEKLGQGSMGTVFKARQLSMNRLVAIKVLLPRLAANPEFIDRFQREARAAATTAPRPGRAVAGLAR